MLNGRTSHKEKPLVNLPVNYPWHRAIKGIIYKSHKAPLFIHSTPISLKAFSLKNARERFIGGWKTMFCGGQILSERLCRERTVDQREATRMAQMHFNLEGQAERFVRDVKDHTNGMHKQRLDLHMIWTFERKNVKVSLNARIIANKACWVKLAKNNNWWISCCSLKLYLASAGKPPRSVFGTRTAELVWFTCWK